MTDEPRSPKLGKGSASAKGVRHVLKAVAGSVPIVGAALAEGADALLPDSDKIEMERWAANVTTTFENLYQRVDQVDGDLRGSRTVSLGPLAFGILQVMLLDDASPVVRPFFSLDELSAALPAVDKPDVKDAVGELEHYELIERRRTIGSSSSIRLTDAAYLAGDEKIRGWNTIHDAIEISRLILSRSEAVLSSELHAATGWPLRRFVPALTVVLGHINDGPKSQTVDPEFPVRHFGVSASDRFALKRFIESR